MKLRHLISILSIVVVFSADLSSQWTGKYIGIINGDNVTMELNQNANLVTGFMKDSYQSYDVTGEVSGNRFAGEAKEKSLALTFTLLGEKNNDAIQFKLLIDLFGQSTETSFTVTKQGQLEVASTASAQTPSVTFPSGATFPAALIGRWTKNETYNSGYGDNFMGGNFSQSVIFNNDGSVIEGGSNASMSGSNYYGQSSDNTNTSADNIKWYAIGNQLHLMIYNNGSWQSVMLGTWYAENNHLLITGQDGKKVLLSR